MPIHGWMQNGVEQVLRSITKPILTQRQLTSTRAMPILLYHSWEIPGQSKRIKHNDKLTLKAGVVAQAGFGTDAVSEALYEQNFELTEDSSIAVSYSLASNVYDGARETDAAITFSYERSF